MVSGTTLTTPEGSGPGQLIQQLATSKINAARHEIPSPVCLHERNLDTLMADVKVTHLNIYFQTDLLIAVFSLRGRDRGRSALCHGESENV